MNDSSPGAPRSARRWLPAAAVFAASVLFQLPFFDRWFSGMDEGHLLLFSEMAAEGGTLYRDANFYPLPGAFYLLALLFRVFEPSVLVARWAVVIEFALFAAVVHDLMRGALAARWAAASVPLLWAYRIWSFPHWQMYSYSTTALLLLALSLWLLLRHLASGRRGPLVAAGFVFGLGVFCKQDYGAAALLATFATLAVATRTAPSPRPGFAAASAAFLLPAAGVGALAGLHFLHRGVLADVLHFCVFAHAAGTVSFPYSTFAPPLPLFSQDPLIRTPAGLAIHFSSLVLTVDWPLIGTSALFRKTVAPEFFAKGLVYGPWLVCALSAAHLARTRARFADPASRVPALTELALLATASSFALLVYVSRPQDYIHVAVMAWPSVCLLLLLAERLLRAHRRIALALALFAVPFTLGMLGYSARLAWLLRAQHDTPVQLERAEGLYVEPGQARMLEDLVAEVRRETRPGEPIAVWPYFPLLHFLADRPGTHRSGYIVWPVAETEHRDRELIEALEAHDVRFIVYNFTQFPTIPRLDEYAPEVYAYLVDHFDVSRVFTSRTFGSKIASLRRQGPAAPSRPLLADPDDARLRIERSEGSEEVVGAERAALLRREAWPFRPALALRPTANGRSVLALPLRAAPGERLRTAVGVHPELWWKLPPAWTTFRIEALSDGTRERLFERTLDPQRRIADRGWFEVNLPLDRLAGRDVVLEFSTATELESNEKLQAAAFAEPRIEPASAAPPGGP